MRLRDLSVGSRLLLANFMMVLISVLLLLLIGSSLVLGLRLSGFVQQDELAVLWPEKGPALSTQFAVSSLRNKADKKKANVRDMEEDCRILEGMGIRTVLRQQERTVYVSSEADEADIMAKVKEACAENPVMMWQGDSFFFYYKGVRSGMEIFSYGEAPFLANDSRLSKAPHIHWDTILMTGIGLAIFIIVLLGIYIARMLSRQILEPLSALEKSASAIRHGDLDTPVAVQTHDEFGSACREFDKMRQELKAARAERERYETNRKELIAGISHDLSTPLTALKGYASGILDGIARTPEKQHHYVQMIYQGACTMEHLVESLFLFSKLDLGRIPFHLEPVDLKAYFTDFVAEQRPILRERGLELELSIETEEKFPMMAAIDRLQFQRVVSNILSNSAKYGQKELVHERISLSRQGDVICLTFADDGAGVAAEDLVKLFDSFYRTDPARSKVAKGSGLGLAIVKQIVLGMKGRISAEASPLGGLAIVIKLPQCTKGKNKMQTGEHETEGIS
ncbi:MAG: histidine kinase [Mitsuokella multacida]|jgi:signal transduction histidine kinase